MQTITRLAVLALSVTLSISPALAQQSVRRPATKTAVRPVRPAVSPTRTPVTPPKQTVAATTPKAEPQAQAPTASPAPVATRQAEPRSQAATQPAPTRPRYSSAASAGRNVYVNAGVGLAAYYGGGLPLGVSVEADVKNNFSVGGSVDYFRYNYGYYSGGYTFIYAGARASYHLGDALNVQSSNFDPYVGATLGFRHARYRDSYGYSYSDYYSNSYNSGLYIGIHAGARYLFSPKIGAFAEVGYGVSALKIGLTGKF